MRQHFKNFLTLLKIGEATGLPRWNGSAWPSSGIEGQTWTGATPPVDTAAYPYWRDTSAMLLAAPTGHSLVRGNTLLVMHPGTSDGAMSYNAYWTSDGTVPSKTNGTKITGVVDSQEITGLTNGILIKIVYTAANLDGESPESTAISCTPSDSPFEVLPTYTEVDIPNKITEITTDKAVFTSLDRSAAEYLYFDFGAAHFSADFVHSGRTKITGGSSAAYSWVYCWMLANYVGTFNQIYTSGQKSMLYLEFDRSAAGVLNLALIEGVAADQYSVSSINLNPNTDYYWKITRDESFGTYGKLTLDIYSDAAMTVLVDSKSLTLHAKTDFRYLFAVNSAGGGTTTDVISGETGELLLA